MARQDIINGKPNELLKEYGYIDIDKAIDALKYATGLDKIDIQFINESSRLGKLYFDENGKPFDDTSNKSESSAKYMVVPTGYKSKTNGYPLCASFIYDRITQWNGIYINTLNGLIERFIEHSDYEDETVINILNDIEPWYDCIGFGYTEIRKHNIEQDTISSYIDTVDTQDTFNIDDTILNNIFERLLYKENWELDKFSRLREYLKHIIQKVYTDISDGIQNGYITSKNKELVCINTGLIDRYMNDIYIVVNRNDNYISLVDAKSYLLNIGFNMDDIIKMPTTIKFYKDKGELIFNGSLTEFDLENTNRLNHIIDERRHRFPDKYRNLKSDILCSKIKASIVNAVKMSEHDYKYFIPMYNFQRNVIQFLAPIYLDNSIDEKPEVVAIIDKTGGFYSINTIISVDDAYNNARLICKPDTNWLNYK